MKIPKKLKVGGRVFRIKHLHHSKEENWGLIKYNSSEILLYRYGLKPLEKMSKQNMEQTFIHELLHAIDSVYNSFGLGEKTTSRLAEGLYQVLKDNKLLK